jgi:hypothetical protein
VESSTWPILAPRCPCRTHNEIKRQLMKYISLVMNETREHNYFTCRDDDRHPFFIIINNSYVYDTFRTDLVFDSLLTTHTTLYNVIYALRLRKDNSNTFCFRCYFQLHEIIVTVALKFAETSIWIRFSGQSYTY